MKSRVWVVMAAWLVLFGCDDDDDRNPTTGTKTPKGQEVMHVMWDAPGCEGKVTSGIVQDKNGNRGKVRISWDYAPAMVVTTLCLGFVVMSAMRKEASCTI
jgi:hypothetical protein